MKALKKNGLGGGLIAALLVMAVLGLFSLTGCASAPETLQIDNTTKIKYSASEFDSGDFYNDIFSSYFSFFTMERVEPVFFGFDGDIFKIMKNSIASGSATKEILSEENSESLKQSLSESLNKTIKRGEIVQFTYPEDSKNEAFISNFIYDKESDRFTSYSFRLVIFEDEYKELKELEELSSNIQSAINECEENIQFCHETIQRCSNPTIQKSRVVQIPYTATQQIWHPGTAGRRTNSSFGSTEGTSGYWETIEYTAYRNETQYYTVPDPNYNPAAVAEAKEWLQYWTSEKKSAEQAWQNTINWQKEMPLPFKLEPMVANINSILN